jgi:hypothetical protein
VALLGEFGGDDLTLFGETIRSFAHEAVSMEGSAQRIASLLYEQLHMADGSPACALVRAYKTHPYGKLPPDLRAFADGVMEGAAIADETRCLTLLGTRGAIPAWNDRRLSAGHQAIPLPSVEFVHRLPMVAGLIEHLGLELADVVRPSEHRVVELAQKTYGVFHVSEAAGSQYVPAQDFVAEHGIRSALGFGGVLFTGDFFAVVMFCREPVSVNVSERVRILSLATRVALMPYGTRVFDTAAAASA